MIDYALDLRNFHEDSHHALLIPILISEKAKEAINNNFEQATNLNDAIKLNSTNLGEFLRKYDNCNLMDVKKMGTISI